MTSAAETVVIRLRTGGVLVVASAAALPWPKVIHRKFRRIQEHGLQLALADPAAMTRLRNAAPAMLAMPMGRTGQFGEDRSLKAALTTAARDGRLTVLFGYSEPPLRQGQPDELRQQFEDHPVVQTTRDGVRAPNLDPEGALPDPSVAVPRGMDERLRWVCGRTPLYLGSGDAAVKREFFSEEALPLTSALLKLWSRSEEVGGGFTVDVGVFAAAYAQLGREASNAFDALAESFSLTRGASGWPALDKAAKRLAFASGRLAAPLLRQFLRRVGDSTGAGGRGYSDEGE